jgi:hypothetical protein
MAAVLVADARYLTIPMDPYTVTRLIMRAVAAPFMAKGLTACIPALSAASIMAATQGDFRHAAERASAGVPMGEASPVAGFMVEVSEVTDEKDAKFTVK